MDTIIDFLKDEAIGGTSYEKIKHILSEYTSKDYKKYISFNDTGYKRNYICSTEKFDIILICWKKGQNSKIHDHPDFCCLVKLLEGRLIEEEYSNINNNLKLINNNLIRVGDIANKEKDQILHRIIPLEDSVSLHIYIPGKYAPNYYTVNY